MVAELKTNNMAYKMKSSPAKQLWPWGKKTKTKKYDDSYETKDVTWDRVGLFSGRDVTKTKTVKRHLLRNPDPNRLTNTWDYLPTHPSGIIREKSKVKTKDGEVVKSKSVVIDKGGDRKTKTKTKKGKTKTVVWDEGVRTKTVTKE